MARCLFWFFCCWVRVLFLGGRRDDEPLAVRGVSGEGVPGFMSVGESMIDMWSSELEEGVIISMVVGLGLIDNYQDVNRVSIYANVCQVVVARCQLVVVEIVRWSEGGRARSRESQVTRGRSRGVAVRRARVRRVRRSRMYIRVTKQLNRRQIVQQRVSGSEAAERGQTRVAKGKIWQVERSEACRTGQMQLQ